jgi:hypothetical protein
MSTPEERREQIRSLRGRGLTQEEIANELGISRATVARDLASLKEEHDGLPSGWNAPVVIKGTPHSIESQPSMAVSLDAFERLREDAVVFETETGHLFAFHPSGYTIMSKLNGISYTVASPLLASLEVDVVEFVRELRNQHAATLSVAKKAKEIMLNQRETLIKQGLANIGDDWLYPPEFNGVVNDFLLPFFHTVGLTARKWLEGTILESVVREDGEFGGLPSSLQDNSTEWAQTSHAPDIFRLIEEISKGVEHLELLRDIAAAYDGSRVEFDSFLPLTSPERAAKEFVEAISSIPKSRLKAAMQQRIADKDAWDEFIQSNAVTREDWEELKESHFDDWNEYTYFRTFEASARRLISGPWAHLGLQEQSDNIILEKLTSLGWDSQSINGAHRLFESGYTIEHEEAPLVEDLLHIDLKTIDGKALKKYINENGTEWIIEGSNPFDIELTHAMLNGPRTVALVKLLETAKQYSGLGRKVSNVDELHGVLSLPPFAQICTSELESGIVTRVKNARMVVATKSEKNKPEHVIPARLPLKPEAIPGFLWDLDARQRDATRLFRAMVANDVEEATIQCWHYLSYTVTQSFPRTIRQGDERANIRIIKRLKSEVDLSKKRIDILHTVRQVRYDLEHPEGEKSGKKPSWSNIAEVLKILELCTPANAEENR